jgi:hypothetical protein
MITVDDIRTKAERFYVSKPSIDYSSDIDLYQINQSEFLRQLDPNSHKILDPLSYHDIWKEVPIDEKDESKGTQWVCNHVERVSIALQNVILSKQLTHLCGESMNFDIMELYPTKDQTDAYISFKQKWMLYQFDTGIYEFIKSVKATADGAIALYKNGNGETSYKTFSILDKDLLHPIFDYTGKLRLFGRTFTNTDEYANNTIANTYLEIWDDKYYYLFSTDEKLNNKKLSIPQWDEFNDFSISTDKEGDTQYYPVIQKEHGFKEVPVVYCKHKTGACWSKIESLIEGLERALSEFFENNKSYAFRIMYISGGFEIEGEMRDNIKQPKAIMLNDPTAKVGMVEGADASGSFKEQLQQTLDMIKLGGFIVTPPTTISGDVSGTAIKILYAPAIEKAINDIHFFNPYIRDIVNLFKESVSTEKDMSPSSLNTIHIRPYLKYYVPQNDTDRVNNLTVAKGSGYLSSETCQEKDPNATPQEAMRIKQEEQEKAIQERNAIVGQSQDTGGTAIIDENSNKGTSAMNPQNTQKKAISKLKNK